MSGWRLMSGWTPWRLLKSQNVILWYANLNLFLYFIHLNKVITKHWNIWCIARGGWVGCYCFLTNILLITFKYLQNIAILCYQFVKLPYLHLLEADENGRMLFLHNEFLLYIFKCKWNRESQAFADKSFYLSFQ